MTMPAAVLLHRAGDAGLTTAFHRAGLGPDDPFASVREIAWQGADAMAAGRIALEGVLESAAFPHVETLLVVAGRLSLTESGKAPLVLEPEQGIVIAAGTALRLEATAGTRLVFCTATGAPSAAPGLTPLRADAAFKPSAPPPVEILLGPVPDCRSANVFTDEATRYRAGTWDSTPYRRIVRPHRVNELMHLLAGSVALEAPDGSVLEVCTGDSVFVPQGAPCGWDSREHVAKFYVVQEVAG